MPDGLTPGKTILVIKAFRKKLVVLYVFKIYRLYSIQKYVFVAFFESLFETYTRGRRKMKSEKMQGLFEFLQEKTVHSRLCIIKNVKCINSKAIGKQFHDTRGKGETYGFPKRRNKAFS